MKATALAVVLTAGGIVGVNCGGSPVTVTVIRTEQATVTETVTETATETVEAAEPEPTQSYPRGFPKVVPIASVPDRMGAYSGLDEGLDAAIALAPGVWARRTPGTSVIENADLGSYFGWCASVEAFERRFGRSDMDSCW